MQAHSLSNSIKRRSLRRRNNGAEKANAMVNVDRITTHKFFICSLRASVKIQMVNAREETIKSLDNDCAAGFTFASSINFTISNPGP